VAGATLKGPNIGARIGRLAQTVEKGSFDTLSRAADKGKSEQMKVIRQHSGGDYRMSGVGRAKGRAGNARVGANYRVTKTKMEAFIKATGPLHLLENDTRGRVIRSAYQTGKYRRASRGSGGAMMSQFIGPALPGSTFRGGRRAVLNIPGVGFRRSARHRGTRGKQTWTLGRKKAEPVIAKTMSGRTTSVIIQGMKG